MTHPLFVLLVKENSLISWIWSWSSSGRTHIEKIMNFFLRRIPVSLNKINIQYIKIIRSWNQSPPAQHSLELSFTFFIFTLLSYWPITFHKKKETFPNFLN